MKGSVKRSEIRDVFACVGCVGDIFRVDLRRRKTNWRERPVAKLSSDEK